jgi:hypothetical protein
VICSACKLVVLPKRNRTGKCIPCYRADYCRANRDKYPRKNYADPYAKSEARKAKAKQRYEKNKENVLEQSKQYYKLHRAKYLTKSRSRRNHMEKYATPTWINFDQLNDIYLKCPDGWHVDHIIPIKNRNVCGLNVPWNLQYLRASDNLSKRNKFDFSNSNEGWMKNGR